MAKYWDTVPSGHWTISNMTDALDALKDEESLATYDRVTHRVNVLGPLGKALIIDLWAIEEGLSDGEVIDLRKQIGNLLGLSFV